MADETDSGVLAKPAESHGSSATLCGVCNEPISQADLGTIASRHLSLQYCLKELGIGTRQRSAVRNSENT